MRAWAAFGAGTFEGVLIYDEQVVHLHLLSKGRLVRCCAAGEQLAGTDAAGQGLGHRKAGHILMLLGTSSCCTTKAKTIGNQKDEWERRSSLGLRNGGTLPAPVDLHDMQGRGSTVEQQH